MKKKIRAAVLEPYSHQQTPRTRTQRTGPHRHRPTHTHARALTHTHTHTHTHTQCRLHTPAANTRNNPAQIPLRAPSQAARFCSGRKPLPGGGTPRTQASCTQKSWGRGGATLKKTHRHSVQAGLTHGTDPFGSLGISRWISGPSPDVSSGWIAPALS